MRPSHKATEDQHQQIRVQALSAAKAAIPLAMKNSKGQTVSGHLVEFGLIDYKSLAEAKNWQSEPGRRVDWDWTGGLADYGWRHPKRFELAVWYKGLFLSGLSLGRPTWSKQSLRLDFIEASPMATPLSGLVTDMVLLAAEVYADAIGATELRIMNPVTEKVKVHYLDAKRGFQFNPNGDYCFKSLK